MKLNLLPTSVSRSSGSRWAWVLAVLIVAASVYAMLSMKAAGETALAKARDDVQQFQAPSDNANAVAGQADTIIAQASGPLLDVQLAQAMNAHNSVYPQFYDEVLSHVPSYFRLTALQATPNDANTCTVTMTGTIGSFQQYANLMFALLQIKGAQAVTRSGYQLNDMYVPPLIPQDQVGRPIKLNGQRLPDDPIQRMDIRIAQAGETNYTGTGGFGTPGTPMQRAAAPGESLITVAVVVTKNLLTPNPRATISGAGAAFASAGGAG